MALRRSRIALGVATAVVSALVTMPSAAVAADESEVSPCSVDGSRTEASGADARIAERYWHAAEALKAAKLSAEARKAAAAGVRRAGGLPADDAQCEAIAKLLAPDQEDKSFWESFSSWFKDVWWIIALVVFGAVALLGFLAQRTWWRSTVPLPRVRLGIEPADASATGFEIGPQLSGIVTTQLMLLDTEGYAPKLRYVGTADADANLPPVDEVPEKAQWVLALVKWILKRNHVSLTMSLVRGANGRVGVINHIREPSGAPTKAAGGDTRQTLIERPSSDPDEAKADDYLPLALPVTAWTLFQIKEIVGEVDELPVRVGTGNWAAYARLLEGTTSLEAGEYEDALTHFRVGMEHDPSPGFYELRLNTAFAMALSGDEKLWELAIDEFEQLLGEIP